MSLLVALLLAIAAAVALGTVSIPFGRVVGIILRHLLGGAEAPGWPPAEEQIVWVFRLPRTLLASVVGAALAVSGAALHAVARNPLADPYIFGVSSGASVGAVAFLTLGHAGAGGLSLAGASEFPRGDYRVTIGNCGNALTFHKPPERVVTLFAPTTEKMMVLGLKERIVGVAWTRGQPVLPELEADYRGLHSLSEASAPSREMLLGLNPDFVFDNQPDYFYNASNGFATREELKAVGAQTYSLSAICGPENGNDSVETIFQDVRNIGMIFGVRDRAEQVVREMQQRISTGLAWVEGRKPVKVMVYVDGEGPLNVIGARSSRHAIFRVLSVENIFPDLDYGPVSIEEVAVRDADVFVVSGSSFGGISEQRVEFLKAALPDSPAVKNNRVLIARALAQQPRLLVLDEPTNHLNIHYQLEILESKTSSTKNTMPPVGDASTSCAACPGLFSARFGSSSEGPRRPLGNIDARSQGWWIICGYPRSWL